VLQDVTPYIREQESETKGGGGQRDTLKREDHLKGGSNTKVTSDNPQVQGNTVAPLNVEV
jgi:hypothetical protein